MRTPFDPRPLDPAPEPSSRVDFQGEPPQTQSTGTGDATPEATLAVVEAAMLVVDAAGIVDVGVRADAAKAVDAAQSLPTAPLAAGEAVVSEPGPAAPGRSASPALGRTIVKVAQFAATAAVLGFLAFGGRVPNLMAAVKAYFPKTRLAEVLNVPSPSTPPSRRAPQPKLEPASAPVVTPPSQPVPSRVAPVAKGTPVATAPEPAATTRPKATASAQARRPAPKPTQRRAAPPAAESRVEATAEVPANVREQQRQEYYLRLMSDGHRLYQLGWYGPAMGRFRQAAAVRPQSQNAHLWIARSAMRTGRYEAARTAAERAIAISPNNDGAREARALLDQLKVVERERL